MINTPDTTARTETAETDNHFIAEMRDRADALDRKYSATNAPEVGMLRRSADALSGDVLDMAAIGRSFMTSLETVTSIDGPYKDWTPAEDPAELVLDLYNDLEEARAALSPQHPVGVREALEKSLTAIASAEEALIERQLWTCRVFAKERTREEIELAGEWCAPIPELRITKDIIATALSHPPAQDAPGAVKTGPLEFGEAVTNIAASDENPIKHGWYLRRSGRDVQYVTKDGRTHNTPPDNLVRRSAASVFSPAPEGEAEQGLEPTEAEIDEWAYAFANWRQGQRSTPRCEEPGERDVQIARELVVGVLASRPATLSSPAPEGEAAQGVDPVPNDHVLQLIAAAELHGFPHTKACLVELLERRKNGAPAADENAALVNALRERDKARSGGLELMALYELELAGRKSAEAARDKAEREVRHERRAKQHAIARSQEWLSYARNLVKRAEKAEQVVAGLREDNDRFKRERAYVVGCNDGYAAGDDERAKLRIALHWYAEQVEGCRKISSEGETARRALDADGGDRARAALRASTEEGKTATPSVKDEEVGRG